MRERLRELAIGAAVAAAAAVAIHSRAVAPLQRHAADALVRLAVEHPPPLAAGLPDVAVVAIDPQSLRRFEAWPWPRRLYAEALAHLDAAGAKAIAFDIDFSTPRDREGDELFAQALARSGRGVLAAYRQLLPMPGGAELEVTNLPCEPLRREAAGIGSVLIPVDADGIVRRAPIASSLGGRTTPSLAAAALARAAGEGDAAPDSPGPVTFSHAFHLGKGFKCADCHPGLFKMQKGGVKLTMDGMAGGKACGACHNGKKAFEVMDGEKCGTCHKAS